MSCGREGGGGSSSTLNGAAVATLAAPPTLARAGFLHQECAAGHNGTYLIEHQLKYTACFHSTSPLRFSRDDIAFWEVCEQMKKVNVCSAMSVGTKDSPQSNATHSFMPENSFVHCHIPGGTPLFRECFTPFFCYPGNYRG